MKKIFVLFLLTVFSFIAHAETGYKGIEWYTEENEVNKRIDLYANTDDKLLSLINSFINIKTKIKLEYKPVLGLKNEIAYLFTKNNTILPKTIQNKNDRFVSVAYIITLENVKLLKNNFSKPAYIYTECRSDFLEFLGNIQPDNIDFFKLDKHTTDLIIKKEIMLITLIADKAGLDTPFVSAALAPDLDSTEKYGTLYIYDYNDDTRVYIYDNIIKDKAVVVYVPHEQDY